jgi:hypothetical protein
MVVVLLYTLCAGAVPVPATPDGPENARAGIADTHRDTGQAALPPDFYLRDGGAGPQSSNLFSERNPRRQDDENSISWIDQVIALCAVVLAACGTAALIIAFFQWTALKGQVGRLEKTIAAVRKAASTRAAETAEALSIANAHSRAALEQAAATGKAADAAIAGQRAWIEITARVAGPLSIDAQGTRFAIGWNIRNLGNTPATQVTVNIQVVPNIFGKYGLKDAVEEAKKACDAERERSGGYTIFPQQMAPGRDTTVTIPRSEFDAAVAAMQKTINGAAIGVAICASYRFWGGTGETVVTYMLSHFQSGTGLGIGLAVPRIPQDDLRLVQQSLFQSAR